MLFTRCSETVSYFQVRDMCLEVAAACCWLFPGKHAEVLVGSGLVYTPGLESWPFRAFVLRHLFQSTSCRMLQHVLQTSSPTLNYFILFLPISVKHLTTAYMADGSHYGGGRIGGKQVCYFSAPFRCPVGVHLEDVSL